MSFHPIQSCAYFKVGKEIKAFAHVKDLSASVKANSSFKNKFSQ